MGELAARDWTKRLGDWDTSQISDARHLTCILQSSGIGLYKNWRSGAFINRLLETLLPTLFHTASALSAPSGHLPLEGKAESERQSRLLKFESRD